MGKRRAMVLAVIQLLMIAHVVQWLWMGTTTTPIEPSEAMETAKHGIINAGAIFFAMALLSTLVLGRWFCGWGCHIVMLQDLCAWMLKKVGIRPRPFRSRVLIYVPLILALYMFIWPVFYRLAIAPWVQPDLTWPGFTMHLTTTDFWKTFPGVMVAIPFLFVCGFVTVYFLGAKGFCTYGCPYGGFFAPLDKLAPLRIRVTDDCEQCGHCTAVCTSNVRVHEEVREYGMVVDPGCMKCLDCVSVCPNEALYVGFGKPAMMADAPKNAAPVRTFDFTIGEEAVFGVLFLGVFLAVRGIYGLVPMLMAAGLSVVIVFIVWKAWRTIRDQNVHVARMQLVRKGRATAAGWGWRAASAALLVLVAHCGAVQVMRLFAEREAARVDVDQRFIFSAAPLELPEDMASARDRAIAQFMRLRPLWDGGLALARDESVEDWLAWLHACRLDFNECARILEGMIARHPTNTELYRRLAIARLTQDREAEAFAVYERALQADPELVELVDDLAQWHVRGHRVDEARAVIKRGLIASPDNLLLLKRLSLIEYQSGNLEDAERLIQRTLEMDASNVRGLIMLAAVLVGQNRAEEAVNALRQAEERAAGDHSILREVATAFDAMGRSEDAAAIRRRLPAEAPVAHED